MLARQLKEAQDDLTQAKQKLRSETERANAFEAQLAKKGRDGAGKSDAVAVCASLCVGMLWTSTCCVCAMFALF